MLARELEPLGFVATQASVGKSSKKGPKSFEPGGAIAVELATREGRPQFTRCDAGGFTVGPYTGLAVEQKDDGVYVARRGFIALSVEALDDSTA